LQQGALQILHGIGLALSVGHALLTIFTGMGLMIRSLSVFAITYFLISRPQWPLTHLKLIHFDRPAAAVVGAVLMVGLGVLTPEQAYRSVDWNTIVLLLGMFLLSGCLHLAGFFEWAAATVISHVHTPTGLLTALVFVSGILSAVLVNDTVCVILAPLVIAVVRRSDLPAVPYLFALAVGANIGSVMTVVGNPQNMIIAHTAPLTYLEFGLALAPIGLVNLGLAAAILRWTFRRDLKRRPIVLKPLTGAALDRPLLIKTIACLALVLIGFVGGFNLAWTALAGSALLFLISGRAPREIMAQVDGPLLLFFGALFVIIAGLDAAQVPAMVFTWLSPLLDGDGLMPVIHFSWVSVLASNVVSNVPYVLVAATVVARLADTHRLWLLLALTSTFAGNLTLFGSVANVIVFEAARHHVRMGFWKFLTIGTPLTLLTTAAGVGLLLLWG
jgi:Na+/H+ antiporter NhaD/arsenite permease-like protein